MLLPDGSTYHMGLRRGDVSSRVLCLTTVARAVALLEMMDPGTEIFGVCSSRLFQVYRCSFRGMQVTLVNTGIGAPSLDFILREMSYVHPEPMAVIRVGTCGLLPDAHSPEIYRKGVAEIAVGDACIAANGASLIQRTFAELGQSEAEHNDGRLTSHLLSSSHAAAAAAAAAAAGFSGVLHSGNRSIPNGVPCGAGTKKDGGCSICGGEESVLAPLNTRVPYLLTPPVRGDTRLLQQLELHARASGVRTFNTAFVSGEFFYDCLGWETPGFCDPDDLSALRAAEGAGAKCYDLGSHQVYHLAKLRNTPMFAASIGIVVASRDWTDPKQQCKYAPANAITKVQQQIAFAALCALTEFKF